MRRNRIILNWVSGGVASNKRQHRINHQSGGDLRKIFTMALLQKKDACVFAPCSEGDFLRNSRLPDQAVLPKNGGEL